jgi:hypothetical protein
MTTKGKHKFFIGDRIMYDGRPAHDVQNARGRVVNVRTGSYVICLDGDNHTRDVPVSRLQPMPPPRFTRGSRVFYDNGCQDCGAGAVVEPVREEFGRDYYMVWRDGRNGAERYDDDRLSPLKRVEED